VARKKSGLGKGLDALFEDNDTRESSAGTELMKISEIEPNRNQPRKEFDQAALEQLADSIREHGIIQPLVVRPTVEGTYQIVAGERRYRAARMAGLTELPVIIRELSDTETMELALIENLQREDLNPVEEALGYRELMEHYDFTQEAVSKSVGKSRPAVANALRLLNLPQAVLNWLKSGELTSGHARALLSMEDDQQILEAAQKIIKNGLTVRDAERMAKEQGQPKEKRNKKPRDSFFDEMELALSDELGRKVTVQGSNPKKKGSIVIEFYNLEDLKEIGNQLAEWYSGKKEE
jgi:ParB family chromosome partitioning protein